MCPFFFVLVFNLLVFAYDTLTVEQAITATIVHYYDIQLLRNDSVSFALAKFSARAAFLPHVN